MSPHTERLILAWMALGCWGLVAFMAGWLAHAHLAPVLFGG